MKKYLLLTCLVVLSIHVFSQCKPDISTNLIALWDFNGNAFDLSGNGNNGTIKGATLTTDRCGNPNSAFSFYGTNQYIDVPDKPLLRLGNTDFTIAAWIYKYDTTINTNYTMVVKRIEDNQTGYHFYVGSTNVGKLGFIVSGNQDPRGYSDSLVSKREWQHVAVTYTLLDSTIRFYIDGILNGITHSIPPPNSTETSVLRIGNDTWVLGPYGFNGKIDDLRMYSRALSVCDIDSLVNAPCQGLQCNDILSSLIAGYNFSGDATDFSGNGHNGTVYNATPTTDRCENLNSAYSFGRSGSTYIEVPNSSPLSLSQTDYTISYWVYEPDSTIRGGNALVKRNGTSLTNGYHTGTFSDTHNMYFTMAGGSAGSYTLVSNSSIDGGMWTHLAVTYSYANREMKMYINGTLDKDTVNVPSPTITNANLEIGRDFINQNAPRFNGKIDDIRIFSRELDSCGIATLYKSACNVLPISLFSFTSKMKSNSILLDWQTSTETNTLYFIIQRSTDGVSFSNLGKVYASGNSNTNKSYSFIDQSPNSGINYYRLQMVDKDGRYTYSKTLPINTSINQLLTVYPNPAKDVLNIQIKQNAAENVSVQIMDMRGNIVSRLSIQLSAGTTTQQIKVSSLAKGSYLLVVKGNTTERKLFMKE